jgi:hypothetical protein
LSAKDRAQGLDRKEEGGRQFAPKAPNDRGDTV